MKKIKGLIGSALLLLAMMSSCTHELEISYWDERPVLPVVRGMVTNNIGEPIKGLVVDCAVLYDDSLLNLISDSNDTIIHWYLAADFTNEQGIYEIFEFDLDFVDYGMSVLVNITDPLNRYFPEQQIAIVERKYIYIDGLGDWGYKEAVANFEMKEIE